jgi:hypothetical protein
MAKGYQRSREMQPFHREALATLSRLRMPFLVGGAHGFQHYTGIERNTKDLDLFARRRDVGDLLACLAAIGCRTEIPFPHWLAKARRGEDFVDVIFSSGNGVARIDDEWFEHSTPARVLGVPVNLCPAEEMIWHRALVMERERFDGADVAHLIRARAGRLRWRRLLRRFGPHWRVLLAHLVLFGFVYPGSRTAAPAGLLRELLARLESELESPDPRERLCQGTLLSRAQYLVDVEEWGLEDARLQREVGMTAEDLREWTAAIPANGPVRAGPRDKPARRMRLV